MPSLNDEWEKIAGKCDPDLNTTQLAKSTFFCGASSILTTVMKLGEAGRLRLDHEAAEVLATLADEVAEVRDGDLAAHAESD